MIPSQSVMLTPPDENPVTVAELKTYLRIDSTEEDDELSAFLSAATARLESEISMKFITQTWACYYDRFPTSKRDPWPEVEGTIDGSIAQLRSPEGIFRFPFGRLKSITSFKTYDDNGDSYTFDASNYYADIYGPVGRLGLKTGSVWPATILRSMNGIEVIAKFGFGDPEDVPAEIKLAIKQLAAKIYESRGDEMPEIPGSAMMLLNPYRNYRV